MIHEAALRLNKSTLRANEIILSTNEAASKVTEQYQHFTGHFQGLKRQIISIFDKIKFFGSQKFDIALR